MLQAKEMSVLFRYLMVGMNTKWVSKLSKCHKVRPLPKELLDCFKDIKRARKMPFSSLEGPLLFTKNKNSVVNLIPIRWWSQLHEPRFFSIKHKDHLLSFSYFKCYMLHANLIPCIIMSLSKSSLDSASVF